jgi:hypothetical protein
VGDRLPPVPAAPESSDGWRGWSSRKKALVGGGIAFAVMVAIGTVVGPRQRPDATPVPTRVAIASGSLTSPTPSTMPSASPALVPTIAPPVPTLTAIASPQGTVAPPPGYVSATEFGASWPLTVEDGFLSCAPPGVVLFAAPSGQRYPVNGLAISRFPDLPDIKEIWALNPDPALANAGLRISIGPLIDRGLELCE